MLVILPKQITTKTKRHRKRRPKHEKQVSTTLIRFNIESTFLSYIVINNKEE